MRPGVVGLLAGDVADLHDVAAGQDGLAGSCLYHFVYNCCFCHNICLCCLCYGFMFSNVCLGWPHGGSTQAHVHTHAHAHTHTHAHAHAHAHAQDVQVII